MGVLCVRSLVCHPYMPIKVDGQNMQISKNDPKPVKYWPKKVQIKSSHPMNAEVGVMESAVSLEQPRRH